MKELFKSVYTCLSYRNNKRSKSLEAQYGCEWSNLRFRKTKCCGNFNATSTDQIAAVVKLLLEFCQLFGREVCSPCTTALQCTRRRRWHTDCPWRRPCLNHSAPSILCCPHMWSINKINSVLATIYFISALSVQADSITVQYSLLMNGRQNAACGEKTNEINEQRLSLMPRFHQDTCCRIQVVSTCVHLSPSTCAMYRRQNYRQLVARLLLDTKGYKSIVA